MKEGRIARVKGLNGDGVGGRGRWLAVVGALAKTRMVEKSSWKLTVC